MFVCCESCVLSGRGLCDGLITRPEESYRMSKDDRIFFQSRVTNSIPAGGTVQRTAAQNGLLNAKPAA
jgi:hypothetical protein